MACTMQTEREFGNASRWLRKIVTVVEDVHTDGGRAPAEQTKRVAAAAVFANPWCRSGFVDDLQDAVAERVPVIARALIMRVLDHIGGPDRLAAFGKGAIVGLDGELEHGAAIVHTPYFGDLYRNLAGAESIIAFADNRGGAGSTLVVPMWHKTAATTRSYYQTIEVRISDAPASDELVMIAAGSSGPRPHPRIGDRTTDSVTIKL